MTEQSGSSGGSCLGCFGDILGIFLVVTFSIGAFKADPEGTGIGHDFKAGFAQIVSAGRSVWDMAREDSTDAR